MSTALNPLSPLPPWILDPSANWVTAKQFSVMYRRGIRRIQQMCRSGEILEFCVATYQDPTGHWWIRLPQ